MESCWDFDWEDSGTRRGCEFLLWERGRDVCVCGAKTLEGTACEDYEGGVTWCLMRVNNTGHDSSVGVHPRAPRYSCQNIAVDTDDFNPIALNEAPMPGTDGSLCL